MSGEKMINVFDLVEDFYAQDEEWNTVLRQKYAEDSAPEKLAGCKRRWAA